ncbi:MAG: OmpA family protein [Flammeovirgaceae bacterium]|nr:OmpA family protein [Flammeovirgaceae bacterium]
MKSCKLSRLQLRTSSIQPRSPFYFVTVIVFYSTSCFSQNLVRNGSFEEFKVCPGSFSQQSPEFRALHWRSANTGTPDQFHECSTGEADVPSNWAGISEAYAGAGYAGIYLWIDRAGNHYREYLETELTETLIKDSVYVIEFNFKLSSYSRYSIDRIGAMVCDSLVSLKHDQAFLDSTQLQHILDSALTQQTGLWEHARWNYKAKGNERFLVIGNFHNNDSTKRYKIQFRPAQQEMLAMGSYYYIDNVRVTPKWRHLQDSLINTENDLIPEAVVLSKDYVLRNIQFEFDSYKLVPPSFEELDCVIDILLKNPTWRVYFSGHTDDRGSESYNLRLSQSRAKTVASYLINQGIEKERIVARGFGKAKPLKNEPSEEARRMNRRVECRFEE